MPVLYVMVGIPGSGKTTWIKEHLPNTISVSTDDIREQLFGDAANQSHPELVFDEYYRRIGQALAAGMNVVADATNTTCKARASIFKKVKIPEGTVTLAVHIDTPLEVARKRNTNRSRVVPDEVLVRMHNQLDKCPPQREEGFNKVFHISPK